MTNIKAKRLESGMTAADLARTIGVTPGAVWLWEQGINTPKAGTLAKLSKIFGCSMEDLLGGEPEPSETIVS